MAPAGGKPSAGLIDDVLAAPAAFDVFQAIRLLDAAAVRAAKEADAPVPPEPGRQGKHAGPGDAVRFRAAVSLAFPGAAIMSAKRLAGDEPAVELAISCFGLVGATGILPQHYTTLLIERIRRHRDTTLRDFLDIFQHRAVSLLYQAWGKYRVPFQRERRLLREDSGASWEDGGRGRDPFDAVLACLVGLGTPGLGDRLRCGDEAPAYFAGHFSRHPRSASSLGGMLAEAFAIAVEVEQFVGRWLVLETPDQTRLASVGMPRGCHARLGIDAMVGQRSWSVDSAIALRLGPLTERDFRRWLPGGERLVALGDLARLYVGPHLEILVRPVLRGSEVPAARLGGPVSLDDGSPAGSRLGWTTWLVSRPPQADADEPEFAVLS
jgi:type VI secretion system protein ImpH